VVNEVTNEVWKLSISKNNISKYQLLPLIGTEKFFKQTRIASENKLINLEVTESKYFIKLLIEVQVMGEKTNIHFLLKQ